MKHTVRNYVFQGYTIQVRDIQRPGPWTGCNRLHWMVWRGNAPAGQLVSQGMAESEQMACLYAQRVVTQLQQRSVQKPAVQTAPTFPAEKTQTKETWTLQELLSEAGIQDGGPLEP